MIARPLSPLLLFLLLMGVVSGQDEDPVDKFLKEAALGLPLSQMEGDLFLLQTIDRINDVSRYHSPYWEEGVSGDEDVVYERAVSDKDADVVVLKGEEDKVSLRPGAVKHTYVVLRRDPDAKPPAYHPVYAYIRNATGDDRDGVVLEDGRRIVLEWDVWEDRRKRRPVVWGSCLATFFVSCGFNESAFSAITTAETKQFVKKEKKISSIPTTNATKKKVVVGDEEEFETPNPDFFDDMNIDLVHGRSLFSGIVAGFTGGLKQVGSVGLSVTKSTASVVANKVLNNSVGSVATKAVGETVAVMSSAATKVMEGGFDGGIEAMGDVAGAAAGATAYAVCGIIGFVGASCKGGQKPRKAKLIKWDGAKPSGPQSGYIPLGVPVSPLPKSLDANPPKITQGTFTPDNAKVPAISGMLVPFGVAKPYLFQTSEATAFGGKLPKESPSFGVYSPAPNSPTAKRDLVHGVMLPVTTGSGIFIPDGMAYPSKLVVTTGKGTVLGYSIPGYRGYPEVFIADSDMANPLRSRDPKIPIPVIVTPEPPNLSGAAVKSGQLYNNKLPPIFIPDTLKATRATFSDDKHTLATPVVGLLVPQRAGEQDLFIPDDETVLSKLKQPLSGTITPNPPSTSPTRSGLLIYPSIAGDEPKFVPDSEGGRVIFTAYDATKLTTPIEGTLVPVDPKKPNEFYPLGVTPPKPSRILGTMTPIVSAAGRKGPIQGELIVNKPSPPFSFIPSGTGTVGVFTPADGGPAIAGAWVPATAGSSDEFIPFDEPDDGMGAMNGTFSDPNNPSVAIGLTFGPPNYPGGPPTLPGAPPRPPSTSNVPPDNGPKGLFQPDDGSQTVSFTPLESTTSTRGNHIAFIPPSTVHYPPGSSPQRGMLKEMKGLEPQRGKITPPSTSGQAATFVPDPPGAVASTFVPDGGGGSPVVGLFLSGNPEKFQPDNAKALPSRSIHGTLTPVVGTSGSQSPISGTCGPAPIPPADTTEFIRDPPGSSVATFTSDTDSANGIRGLFIPGEGVETTGSFKIFESTVITIRVGTHGSLSLGLGSNGSTLAGILVPPTLSGQPFTFTQDPKDSIRVNFFSDVRPETGIAGMYLPLSTGNVGKFTAFDVSMVVALPISGVMVPLVPGTKSDNVHGVLGSGSPMLTFTLDPEGSVLVTFVSDINIRSTMRGLYTPAMDKDKPAKFSPLNPEDYGSKVPLSALQGSIFGDKAGFSKLHGTLTPPSSKDQPASFLVDPEGSTPTSIFLDIAPSTPVPGTWRPGTPLPAFFPLDPNGFPPGDNHGQVSLPGGSPSLMGTFHNPPPNGGSRLGPITFTQDSPNTVKAEYVTDESPKRIPGMYTTGQPGSFLPTRASDLPSTPGHGQMVPTGGVGVGQPGRIEPASGGGVAIFNPDPPGSTPATFRSDGSVDQEFKGVYTPPSQSGLPGSFFPINPNDNPKNEVHGRVTPIAGVASTGTLSPPTTPKGPASFVGDIPSTFTPDANTKNVIHGVVMSGKAGTRFIPDIPFQIPLQASPGLLSSPGSPEPLRHGLLNPTTSPLGNSVFKPDPPDMISGKLSFVGSSSSLIAGLMTMGPPPRTFKAYNVLGVTDGAVTFTPDAPVGAPPQSGSLICSNDPTKATCTFKPMKIGSIPGVLSIFAADDPVPGTLSLEGTVGSFLLDNPEHAKRFPPKGGIATFILITTTTIITRTITVVTITTVTTTVITFTLIPPRPTSIKASFSSPSFPGGLRGTWVFPPYAAAEASFIPEDEGAAAKVKEPTRGIMTPQDGGPSTDFTPVSGTVMPSLSNGGVGVLLLFIPDLGSPTQASFHPSTAPNSRIRGTFTDPTMLGGSGAFSVIPSDATRIPRIPTAGVMVKMSGGDAISGVFIPPTGDSPLASFKPDSGVGATEGGGGTHAASLSSSQAQSAQLIMSSGEMLTGSLILGSGNGKPARFHPSDPSSLSRMPEGGSTISMGDKLLKCTVQKPPPGQPFALINIRAADTGLIPSVFIVDSDPPKRITGMLFAGSGEFVPDAFLEEDYIEPLVGTIVPSTGGGDPIPGKMSAPSGPGKPAGFAPAPKPPTKAVFHFNDQPTVAVSGVWEEPVKQGVPGLFRVQAVEGAKLRQLTTEGLLLVENGLPLKGKMLPYLGPSMEPAHFLPNVEVSEGSGPGYFYPFGQSNIAIMGTGAVPGVPGSPGTFVPERWSDLTTIASSGDTAGVFVPFAPNGKPVVMMLSLSTTSQSATFITVTYRTRITSTIITTTVTTTTLSGWFTLPQTPQGVGIFHPSEGGGGLAGMRMSGTESTVRATIALSQLPNAQPLSCTLNIPANPMDPIFVTMDPLPPKAASFIPLDNPNSRISGTCGEPWGGSATPTPFQPHPSAAIPTGSTAGWVVIEELGGVPMKGMITPVTGGGLSFNPDPASVGNVQNVVGYLSGDSGPGIEGRVEVSQGTGAGSDGVFVPNNLPHFLQRLTRENNFMTFHYTTTTTTTITTTTTTWTKLFQAVIRKPSPGDTSITFMVDPLSKPQTAYFTPDGTSLQLSGQTIPPRLPTDLVQFRPDDLATFSALVKKGTVPGKIFVITRKRIKTSTTTSTSTSTFTTTLSHSESKTGGGFSIALDSGIPTTSVYANGLQIKGAYTATPPGEPGVFIPEVGAKMPTSNYTGQMLKDGLGSSPITGTFVPTGNKILFYPDPITEVKGTSATMIVMLANGDKVVTAGTLVPSVTGAQDVFVPVDSRDELDRILPPGSSSISAMVISSDPTASPIPVSVSPPSAPGAPIVVSPDPKTLPGPASLYIEGHPSTPIAGQFAPSSGTGGGAFVPDDPVLLAKLSSDGNGGNRGTVVHHIPGSLPIPVNLESSPGPGLPINLSPDPKATSPGAIFTPLSNPSLTISGSFTRTPGSNQDIFVPNSKDAAKLPPGPTQGYILIPGGETRKGTISPPVDSFLPPTFLQDPTAMKKATLTFFSNTKMSMTGFYSKTTRIIKKTTTTTTTSSSRQIMQLVNTDDGAKINPGGEVATLWDGDPSSKPSLVLVYPPAPGQTEPTITHVDEDNPLPAVFIQDGKPDTKISGIWVPSPSHSTPGQFIPDGGLQGQWLTMGLKGSISLVTRTSSQTTTSTTQILRGTVMSSHSGATTFLPDIPNQPQPAVFYPTPIASTAVSSGSQSTSPPSIGGTYTPTSVDGKPGFFTPNPEEAYKLPKGDAAMAGFVTFPVVGLAPIPGTLQGDKKFVTPEPLTTTSPTGAITQKGVFRKYGSPLMDIPGSFTFTPNLSGGGTSSTFVPNSATGLLPLVLGDHDGIFISAVPNSHPMPLTFSSTAPGVFTTKIITKKIIKSIMTVTTKTGVKVMLTGNFSPSPTPGEAEIFVPDDHARLKQLKQELKEESVQVTVSTGGGNDTVIKATLHLDQIAGDGVPSFPLTVDERPPAPAFFTPLDQPMQTISGTYTPPGGDSSTATGTIQLSAKMGTEPVAGFMVMESHSSALTKGVLYPPTDPYSPATFKPDGVTLNEPKDATFMAYGESKTTVTGKVQIAQDGSVAQFIPTGSTVPFPPSGLQGVILTRGQVPLPCFLSPPPSGLLFYSAALVKRVTTRTVTVTSSDKKVTFLAKYTPPAVLGGQGSFAPLDNVPIPPGPLTVSFTPAEGGKPTSGTVVIDPLGGPSSFTPDPVAGTVYFFPTSNPADKITATVTQTPIPNAPISITIRPEDLSKLPKDPTSMPMVFDGVSAPPLHGLLVASSQNNSGVTMTTTFTLLPPMEDNGGKATFSPFDHPDVVIQGSLLPSQDPSQPPTFLPDNPSQLVATLPKEGSRGTVTSSAAGAKPLVGLVVPPGQGEPNIAATLVPDTPSAPGPAVFRPIGHPELVVYGQFIPYSGGGGVFRPSNPQQMKSLPPGSHAGSVEGTGMMKIKFTLHKTTKSTSTTTSTTTTVSKSSGSSSGDFDFNFVSDKTTPPSPAFFFPANQPSMKIAGTYTQTQEGGQFVPADGTTLPPGSSTGFIVPQAPGLAPVEGTLKFNQDQPHAPTEFKPVDVTSGVGIGGGGIGGGGGVVGGVGSGGVGGVGIGGGSVGERQDRPQQGQPAVLYPSGYPDVKLVGTLLQSPDGSSNFIPNDPNGLSSFPASNSALHGTVIPLRAGNPPLTVTLRIRHIKKTTTTASTTSKFSSTLQLTTLDHSSATECSFVSSLLANAVFQGECTHPPMPGGPLVFTPNDDTFYSQLPKGPSSGGFILEGSSVPIDGVVNLPTSGNNSCAFQPSSTSTQWSFSPASNPSLRIPGSFVATEGGSVFKARNPEQMVELGHGSIDGFLVPSTPGSSVAKGSIINGEGGGLAEFRSDVQASSGGQAMFIPDGGGPPVPGVFQLPSDPKGQGFFVPASGISGVSLSAMSGVVIPALPGFVPFTITLKKTTRSKTTTTNTLTFQQVKAGVTSFPATFTLGSNSAVKISGSYTIPEGGESGVFVPLNPNDLNGLPPGASVGSVTSSALPLPTPGTISIAPGDGSINKGSAIFSPSPPKDVRASFISSLDPNLRISGTYTADDPPGSSSVGGSFTPNPEDAAKLPPGAAVDGHIVVEGSPLVPPIQVTITPGSGPKEAAKVERPPAPKPLMMTEPAAFHPDESPGVSVQGILHYSRVPGVQSYFLPYSVANFVKITKIKKISTTTKSTTSTNLMMQSGTIVPTSVSISPIRGRVDIGDGSDTAKAKFVPDKTTSAGGAVAGVLTGSGSGDKPLQIPGIFLSPIGPGDSPTFIPDRAADMAKLPPNTTATFVPTPSFGDRSVSDGAITSASSGSQLITFTTASASSIGSGSTGQSNQVILKAASTTAVGMTTASFSPNANPGLLVVGKFTPSDDGGGGLLLSNKNDVKKLTTLGNGGGIDGFLVLTTTSYTYRGFLSASTGGNDMLWSFSVSSTAAKSGMESCVLAPDTPGAASIPGSCTFGSSASQAKFIPLRPGDMSKLGSGGGGGTLFPMASNSPPARVSFPSGQMAEWKTGSVIRFTKRVVTTTRITSSTTTTTIMTTFTILEQGGRLSFFSPLQPGLRVSGSFKMAGGGGGGEVGIFTASAPTELAKFGVQGSVSGFLVVDGAGDVAPIGIFLTLNGGPTAKVWPAGGGSSGGSGIGQAASAFYTSDVETGKIVGGLYTPSDQDGAAGEFVVNVGQRLTGISQGWLKYEGGQIRHGTMDASFTPAKFIPEPSIPSPMTFYPSGAATGSGVHGTLIPPTKPGEVTKFLADDGSEFSPSAGLVLFDRPGALPLQFISSTESMGGGITGTQVRQQLTPQSTGQMVSQSGSLIGQKSTSQTGSSQVGSHVGQQSKFQTGSQGGLQADQQSMSQLRSQAGPLGGSQTAQQSGSQAGSHVASQGASQVTTQLTSQAATQSGSQAKQHSGSQVGSQTGPQAGHQYGPQGGSQAAPISSSQVEQQSMSQVESQVGSHGSSQVATQVTSQVGMQSSGSQVGSQAGIQTSGSQVGSQAAMQTSGSQVGSQAGSQNGLQVAQQSGTQVVSQAGSPGVSPVGSQGGLQETSQSTSQAGTQASALQIGPQAGPQSGSQVGQKSGSQVVSQTGSQLSSQVTSQAGMQASGSQVGSQAGIQTSGSQVGSPAGMQTSGSQVGSQAGIETSGSQVSSQAGMQTSGSTAGSQNGLQVAQQSGTQVVSQAGSPGVSPVGSQGGLQATSQSTSQAGTQASASQVGSQARQQSSAQTEQQSASQLMSQAGTLLSSRTGQQFGSQMESETRLQAESQMSQSSSQLSSQMLTSFSLKSAAPTAPTAPGGSLGATPAATPAPALPMQKATAEQVMQSQHMAILQQAKEQIITQQETSIQHLSTTTKIDSKTIMSESGIKTSSNTTTSTMSSSSGAISSSGPAAVVMAASMTADEQNTFQTLLHGGGASTNPDTPEDLYSPPKYEVSLVPMGAEKPPMGMSEQKDMVVSIRGMYFTNTITTTTFIPFTGVMGSFVINNVSPVDPKVQRIEGTLIPRQPISATDYGESKYDAEFIVDPTRASNTNPTTLPPKQTGVFFSLGSTATGISGYIIAKVGKVLEFHFFATAAKEIGAWKQKGQSGCFMFNEMGEIIPFDDMVLVKRAEEEKRVPVPIKVFNFQGAANAPKYDIYYPLEGGKGKFSVNGGSIVVHGHLLPIGRAATGTFTPDNPTLNELIAKGPIVGSFEQDESPAVTGIFPNNGITGKLSFNNGVWSMAFDKPGRRGQLTPGKKPLPGFYVYCVGLVQNAVVEPQLGGSGGKSKGRGFGKRKPSISIVRNLLQQNFSQFLEHSGYARPELVSPSPDPQLLFNISLPTPNGAGAGQQGGIGGWLHLSTTAYWMFIPDTGTIGTMTMIFPPDMPSFPGTLTNSGEDLMSFIPLENELEKVLGRVSRLRGHFTPKDATAQEGAIPLIFTKGRIALLRPGIRGRLQSSGIFTSQLRPTSAVPVGSSHGATYGKGANIFFPDSPHTNGTFLVGKKGTSLVGQLYSPTGADAIFWILQEDPKFLPSNTTIGSFLLDGGKEVRGILHPTKLPQMYIFSSQLIPVPGWVTKDSVFLPDAPADIELHPGWKTQFAASITPNMTLTWDQEIFYGFGNCPYIPLAPGQLLRASTDQDVLGFYLQLLRTHCTSESRRHAANLLQQDYLVVKDKLLLIPEDSSFLSAAKLTREQTESLSAAFELSVFSVAYAEGVKKGGGLDPIRSQDGRISRAVHFLVEHSLLSLQLGKELVPRHALRMARNLVSTLVTALTKLRQDADVLGGCDECVTDKEVNRNDCLQLMAMVQFVIHEGVGAQGDLKTAFTTFSTKHKDFVARMVDKMGED